MRNHRVLTLAGAGSAVAAALALWAFLFVPTPQTTVQAATIFASFREAVGNAFQITFENIGDEGVRASGRVAVVFDVAGGQAAPFGSQAKGVFVEADVRADEGADDDLAGLDVEVAVALVPGDEWVFLKLNGLPTEVVDEEPLAVWLQSMAQDGLLLDLDGIMEREEIEDILEQVSITTHLSEAADKDRRHTVKVKDIDVDIFEKDESDEAAEFDEAELARLGLNVLTGQATPEEFESLVSLIERAATDVTVVETEPGLHVLTASGFDFKEDEEAERFVGRMVLQIAYREGVGLAWATLEHLGPYDGTVRFEMTDLTVDDELFNRERYLANGKTRRFNLGSLIEVFGAAEKRPQAGGCCGRVDSTLRANSYASSE